MNSEFSQSSIREQLSRILGHEGFKRSQRSSRFLTFIVEEALAGRGALLKEFVVAADVFELGDNFDPSANPIVRVEAGRVRKKLATYYEAEGSEDPILITIPKGGYAPRFAPKELQSMADGTPPPVSVPEPVAAPVLEPVATSKNRTGIMAALGAFVIVISAGAALFFGGFLNFGQAAKEPIALPLGKEVLVFEDMRNIDNDPVMKDALKRFRFELEHALRQFGDLTIVHARGRDHKQLPYSRYALLHADMHRHDDAIDVELRLVRQPLGDALMVQELEYDPEPGNETKLINELTRTAAIEIAAPLGATSEMARQDLSVDRSTQEANSCIFYGLYFWRRPHHMNIDKLTECLHRVTDEHPNSATAWAARSIMHLDNARYLAVASDQIKSELAQALDAARAATRIDHKNVDAVRAEYSILFALGQMSEFERFADGALKLNPANIHTIADIARLYAFSGNWEQGQKYYEQSVNYEVDVPDWFDLTKAHLEFDKGNYEGVLKELKHVRWSQDFDRYLLKSVTLAALDRMDEARISLGELLEHYPEVTNRLHDAFNMWNLKPEIREVFVTQLAKLGVELPQPKREWKSVINAVLLGN